MFNVAKTECNNKFCYILTDQMASDQTGFSADTPRQFDDLAMELP